MIDGFCKRVDRLFNRHQFVRRTSVVLSWAMLGYILFGDPSENEKLALIAIASGVILWYHRDRGKGAKSEPAVL